MNDQESHRGKGTKGFVAKEPEFCPSMPSPVPPNEALQPLVSSHWLDWLGVSQLSTRASHHWLRCARCARFPPNRPGATVTNPMLVCSCMSLLLTICTCLLERFKPTAGLVSHFFNADIVPKPLDLDPYNTIPVPDECRVIWGQPKAPPMTLRVPHHLRHAQRSAAC